MNGGRVVRFLWMVVCAVPQKIVDWSDQILERVRGEYLVPIDDEEATIYWFRYGNRYIDRCTMQAYGLKRHVKQMRADRPLYDQQCEEFWDYLEGLADKNGRADEDGR